MQLVVGVAFNKNGRVYNFEVEERNYEINDEVIVSTEKGLQFGYVMTEVREINTDEYSIPLKPVVRMAGAKDKSINAKNIKDAQKALEEAKKIVEELELDMRLVDANYTFDRKQLFFNFISDDRIDFRELAKRLAQIYKTRIELRQIGIRDRAKEIGGIGPCGRLLCCNVFLTDLNGVTINMAKNQNLALNPNKINGLCGRLLCCLNYEDKVYTKLKENLPNVGESIKNKEIEGKVVEVNVLKGIFYVEDEKGIRHEVEAKHGRN